MAQAKRAKSRAAREQTKRPPAKRPPAKRRATTAGALAQAVERLLDAAAKEWSSKASAKAYAELKRLEAKASPADLDRACAVLAPALAGEWSGHEVGRLALFLGSLVEHGAAPEPQLRSLLSVARHAATGALRIARKLPGCDDHDGHGHGHPDHGGHDHGGHDHGDDCDHEGHDGHGHAHHDHDAELEAAFDALREELPAEAQAWDAFEETALALIAHLSRSAKARATARKDAKLRAAVAELAGLTCPPNTGFLAELLQVLDDEPLLVLHPASKRGFEVTISGIVDNFQLHTLLADVLVPLGVPGERPPAAVARCMRGEGPQQVSTPSVGAFNLHQWTGLDRRGALRTGQTSAASAHWLWNEGVPADIQAFEGRRVVLIGPAPYRRSWNTARHFEAMAARVEVTRTLDAKEAQAWLRKLARAPRPKEKQ